MAIFAAQSRPFLYVVAAAVLPLTFVAPLVQPQTPAARQTRVVLLGTGNPAADPDRSGPATAIVAWRPGITATASTPDQLIREIGARYAGRFVVGRDLDVY